MTRWTMRWPPQRETRPDRPAVRPAMLVMMTLWLGGCTAEESDSERSVEVRRGSVVRHAVAVGRIEVEHDVPVKSGTGGILTRLFVTLGQRVEPAEVLAEVRPVLTEARLIEAERALLAAREGEESAREYAEGSHLASWAMRLFTGKKTLERMHRGATRGRRDAEERLALLKEGKATVDERLIDSRVRAPVGGHVISLDAREGAPIVAASSYGSGTVVMTLADLDRLVFKGTVDEIDVGRLRTGMAADIRIGALPGRSFTGKLTEIALRSREANGATTFAIRIELESVAGSTLRSGYSAVASIEVARRDDVLVLPERVVELTGQGALVRVADGDGRGTRRKVETGLSDGLSIEIEGLPEGTRVFERTFEQRP